MKKPTKKQTTELKKLLKGFPKLTKKQQEESDKHNRQVAKETIDGLNHIKEDKQD